MARAVACLGRRNADEVCSGAWIGWILVQHCYIGTGTKRIMDFFTLHAHEMERMQYLDCTSSCIEGVGVSVIAPADHYGDINHASYT